MKLIAIDGNSLMFRAFYALPGMTNRGGTPTGALHGFLSMLMKLVEMKPDYMLVGFDLPVKTFRHEAYTEYKAGRKETPAELIAQFPILKKLLAEMGIAVIECERYEADDILGTFSRKANAEGVDALLVTGDRDALQLITPMTHVLMTRKGITETIEYDEAALMSEYGLDSAHMVDLKGLMGDSSDNLPGVKGVGEKTALKLLTKYGTLENVLANAENEKGALREKLIAGAENARLSYHLGTINTSAPVKAELSDTVFQLSRLKNALPSLMELELRAVIKRIKDIAGSEPETEVHEVYAESKPNFESVALSNIDELKSAVSNLVNKPYLAFHITEDYVSFAGADANFGFEEEYCIHLGGTLLEPGFMPQEVIECLRPLLEAEHIGKILFDGKHIMTLLIGFSIELKTLHFDAMIADYLLNPLHPAKELNALTEENGLGSGGAGALILIYRTLSDKLKANGLEKLYYEVELPLVSVLFNMEQTGFMTDGKVLTELGNHMKGRASELEKEIYALADEKFNIQSPKQLGVILFEKLALPPKKKTKTGYSTDSDVLESLKELHPIVPLIIEYRFLTKLNSTFIDAMLKKRDVNGRIHTTLNQNITATGRISSQDPNLQNIPVRTELGREIRRAFIASPGNRLVGADYSQIELRVLAHMSGDEALISAFNDGDDIHTRTASEVFGVPKSEVTKEMRSAAKAVNFGIVYGISAFGLAEQLGVPQRRAAEYIEKYLSRCTGVEKFMHEAVERGKRLGYAETMMGRRRPLPELNSSNHNTRSFGERVAMNMPIQGSAADIIKIAMVRVHRMLKKEGLKAKLVLQIHDELIIDTPVDEVERVKVLLQSCMIEAAQLAVPLAADVNSGESWFDTK